MNIERPIIDQELSCLGQQGEQAVLAFKAIGWLQNYARTTYNFGWERTLYSEQDEIVSNIKMYGCDVDNWPNISVGIDEIHRRYLMDRYDMLDGLNRLRVVVGITALNHKTKELDLKLCLYEHSEEDASYSNSYVNMIGESLREKVSEYRMLLLYRDEMFLNVISASTW